MSKAKAVLGKDFMLFVGGKALALATSCKLSISAETIDTQSKDSGIWTEKDIKKLSWNGSSENLFSADKGISGYDTLFDLMLNCQPVEAKFGIPANADASEVPSGGWSLPAASYSGQVLLPVWNSTLRTVTKPRFRQRLRGRARLVRERQTVR